MEKVEYRVRPVTRYYVTRYEEGDGGKSVGSSGHGEFDNEATAYEVAYALCCSEHQKLGWPLGDDRIQYPQKLTQSAIERFTDSERVEKRLQFVELAMNGGRDPSALVDFAKKIEAFVFEVPH